MKELAATVIVFKRFGIVTVKKTVMMGRMKMIAVRKIKLLIFKYKSLVAKIFFSKLYYSHKS